MRKIMTVALLALTATSASAISRYNALDHSCEAIQSIIMQQGAAIFRYPSPRKNGLTLYDRYVQDRGFCGNHQMAESVLIPSSDSDRCPVRHCVTTDCDDGMFGGCLFQ
jgi:hypothetical protein